jgi:hypothetical protein
LAENDNDGPIRRAKKSARNKPNMKAPSPEKAEPSVAETAPAPAEPAPAPTEAAAAAAAAAAPETVAKPAEAAPSPPESVAAPVAAEAPAKEPEVAAAPPAAGHDHGAGEASCPKCTRLRAALRADRKRLRRLTAENKTLREELLSAGEMIENLAQDLEKPY